MNLLKLLGHPPAPGGVPIAQVHTAATPRETTHVEDMKNSDKILFPTCNLILVAFGEDESVDCTPFSLLGDLPLHLVHGPAVGAWGKYTARRKDCRPGSRSQLSNCIEDRLVELV